MEEGGREAALPLRLAKPNAEDTATRKMHLLDLPVDVLKEVVKNLTHTNDLTSIALAHSALHALAIPHIYSRFDIVWPDGTSAGEPRGGVDALTYGLATLNMAEDVFGEAGWQKERRHMLTANTGAKQARPLSERQIRKRRGNYYARYIRKFSLGNGPSDWVEEYLTNKEAGKMLGTLVALALARMKSLESFVWDMPTGIIGDIWTSLSYLGDREDGEPCRLEKIWVRWHKNTLLFPPMTPPPPPDSTIPYFRIDQSNALARTEHPSFSVLPPLRSLSVLDVDEMQYLDEMSVLIGRSLKKLRELRVGIAVDNRKDDWVVPWSGESYEQIDLSNPVRSTVTIGGRRRGGVLGVLTSSFLDLKQRDSPKGSPHRLRRRSGAIPLAPSARDDTGIATSTATILQPPNAIPVAVNNAVDHQPETATESNLKLTHSPLAMVTSLPVDIPLPPDYSNVDGEHTLDQPLADASASPSDSVPLPSTPPQTHPNFALDQDDVDRSELTRLKTQDSDFDFRLEEGPRRLTLETLELEWVQLSIPVMMAGFDWTKLTSITLLDCAHHDDLWNALHEEHAKDLRNARSSTYASPKSRRASIPHLNAVRLRLKSIHTNTVTLPLIRFINECLAPNTLEAIYFQDFSGAAPVVSLDTIFNAVVKLHRLSMKRLLIDSCKRRKGGHVGRGSSWKHWAFGTDQLKYLTSGKIPNIRELGFCIDYSKDWHYFKQRLPGLTHLRSLYVPRYTSPYDAPEPTPKDLAMQLLDAVIFNPEMELCYIGIYDKCYEVLEGEQDRSSRDGVVVSSSRGHGDESSDDDDEEVDDEDDDDDDDGEDDQHLTVDNRRASTGTDFEYAGSESDDDTTSDADEKLHIREILFYDDKVPIFRVRHGKL